MNSDTLFNNEKDKTSPTRHFEVTHSEEDDEDQPISLSPLSSTDESHSTADAITTEVESLDDKPLNKLYDDWLEIDAALRAYEPKHKEYVRKLDEVESLKTKYRDEFDKYKKKIDQLQKDLVKVRKTHLDKDETTKKTVSPSASNSLNLKSSKSTVDLIQHISPSIAFEQRLIRPLHSVGSSPSLAKVVETLSSRERFDLISDGVTAHSLYLSRISDTLPRKNPYLKVILGGVDVSILNKADKWTYKQEYEKFKFYVTCISLVSSLCIWLLSSRYRAFDSSFHFLLVWYYCTLTIRESILLVNGSNINRWWRAHHFVATVATGILLTWPESRSYNSFRTQFFVFSFYLSFIQVLQFYYQRGCLYRLRALGETHDMDITIEGFHRWMFRGLSFLVPFLLVGYFFQLYNSYTLWQLAHLPTTHEWQVSVMAVVFFVLFLGNILTTLSVLRDKFREKTRPVMLKQKYQSFKTFLSTNYHRRSHSFNQLRTRRKQSEQQETNNNAAETTISSKND